MKDFFKQYSYSMIKMFVNQFAISIFGFGLAMATIASGNDVVSLIASIFSICFYLFLIYTMTWEIGAKDRISVDVGKKPYRPHTGLLLSAIANIPNMILAVVYLIGAPFMQSQKWAGTMNGALVVVSLFMEGMYYGVIYTVTSPAEGAPMRPAWFMYFLIIIPAMLTAWIAYYAGFKNFRLVAKYFDKKPGQGTQK